MNLQQSKTLSDQDLIKLITERQAGWRNILSVLLQRHHHALLARCYCFLKNREDAEDATQETELRVFRAVQNFRGDASFRTWLFSIADNQCYDLIRRRSRLLIDDHLRALIEIHENSINKSGASTDHLNIVNQVLTKLPQQERDIIILRFYLELSLQDVAATLDIGLSATKMRLYRALDKFSILLNIEQRSVPVNDSFTVCI